MKTLLSTNIKKLRKSNNLTQQQLADSMNVTIGAVHKWENDISTPDLQTIMDLANFFNISVDALIGYEAQNTNIQDILLKIKELENAERVDEALKLADKLINLHPNNFDVLFQTGILYERSCFISTHKSNRNKEERLNRALELLEKSLMFVNETSEIEMNTYNVKSAIADIYILKNDNRKTAEILKRINYEKVNNSRIANILIEMNNTPNKEINEYLNFGFLADANRLFRTMVVLLLYYDKYKNQEKSLDLIDFSISYITSLQDRDGLSYFNKFLGYLHFRKAIFIAEKGENYHDELNKAYEEMLKYDNGSCFSSRHIRFTFDDIKDVPMGDDIAETAKEVIENNIVKINLVGPQILKEWETLNNEK